MSLINSGTYPNGVLSLWCSVPRKEDSVLTLMKLCSKVFVGTQAILRINYCQ